MTSIKAGSLRPDNFAVVHSLMAKSVSRRSILQDGDDEQIVPIDDSALLSSKIVQGAILKVYPGAPHGLLAFCKGWAALPMRLPGCAGLYRRPAPRTSQRRPRGV